MSYSLPTIRPNTTGVSSLDFPQTEYGVPERFNNGLGTIKDKLEPVHPLEYPEKNYSANLHKMNMTILRNTQGLHAPLRISAELKAVRSVGRLPFMTSSNIAEATLLGQDDCIDFSDFLNPSDFNERLVNPQRVIEHKLGIL